MSSSPSVTLTLMNGKGLHARAAAKFVKTSEKFDAEVRVLRAGFDVSGRSIMGLMMLAARYGTEITVQATGSQASEALQALSDLVSSKFGEE